MDRKCPLCGAPLRSVPTPGGGVTFLDPEPVLSGNYQIVAGLALQLSRERLNSPKPISGLRYILHRATCRQRLTQKGAPA